MDDSLNLEIEEFYEHLLTVLPDMYDVDLIPLVFNLLLVYSQERPATLIDGRDFGEQLFSTPEFTSFLDQEGLFYGKITTEGVPQLWIWNDEVVPLLSSPEFVSFLSQVAHWSSWSRSRDLPKPDSHVEDAHYYRGLLLGFPCPGYFREAFRTKSLLVSMTIDGIQVYSYMCPITPGNIRETEDRYSRFQPYAAMMGYDLDLHIREKVVTFR